MAQNIERWMLIDGYNNYEVSSFGRVRNNVTNKILKQGLRPDQRHQIVLSLETKKKTHKVHRLVAFAFCDNPNECDYIDHIDRNPQNNHISNLQWTTPRRNSQNRTKSSKNTSGKQGVYRYTDKRKDLHYWRVQIYDNTGKVIAKLFSIKKLGDAEAKRQAIEHRRQLEVQYGYTGD
jgi:hypothetical protein